MSRTVVQVLRVYVEGRAVPKGSLRRNRYGATFNQGGARLATWMRAIGMTALAARVGHRDVPALGPVRMGMTFYLARPASPKESAYPVSGDLDKLARAVLDALTGVWYGDDSQVTELVCAKRWAERQDPGVEVWMEWGG